MVVVVVLVVVVVVVVVLNLMSANMYVAQVSVQIHMMVMCVIGNAF